MECGMCGIKYSYTDSQIKIADFIAKDVQGNSVETNAMARQEHMSMTTRSKERTYHIKTRQKGSQVTHADANANTITEGNAGEYS